MGQGNAMITRFPAKNQTFSSLRLGSKGVLLPYNSKRFFRVVSHGAKGRLEQVASRSIRNISLLFIKRVLSTNGKGLLVYG